MMKLDQFLLLKLAEECAEVAQMAMKCMQFGLEEVKFDQELSNAERLYAEINDVLAHIKMLNDQTIGFDFKPSEAAQKRKIQKVWYYYEYSKDRGMVE